MAEKDPMTGIMDSLDDSFKKSGMKTSREGNHITVQSWDKKAEKYRKEAKTGGTDAPPPADVVQEMADKKAAAKASVAPTTKTEMGKPFAKGGMTASSRGDGCAQRGKTKGTMVGMKNGGMC
jgi:hypothetical protein